VRVTDQEKQVLGVMSLQEALAIAQDEDVDLIMITPDASPPGERAR
jgi:translation initiation factor IF-3